MPLLNRSSRLSRGKQSLDTLREPLAGTSISDLMSLLPRQSRNVHKTICHHTDFLVLGVLARQGGDVVEPPAKGCPDHLPRTGHACVMRLAAFSRCSASIDCCALVQKCTRAGEFLSRVPTSQAPCRLHLVFADESSNGLPPMPM